MSLLPLFREGTISRPEPLYWRWGGKLAYREGDWKLVADDPPTMPKLYNLADDQAEADDRAASEPQRLAAMLERLAKHTAEVEADGPGWWRTEPMNGLNKKNDRRPAGDAPDGR